MKKILYNDKVSYVMQLIDIYSVLFIKNSKLWLAEQEKEYLAMMIVANSEGIDIDSTEAVRYIKSLGFKGNPYMYKTKVCNKKWMVVGDNGTSLPPAFDYSGGKFKERIQFKFEVCYEHEVGPKVGPDSTEASDEVQLDRTTD